VIAHVLWAAIYRARVQGVHPALGDDAWPDVTLLSAIERQAGAREQDHQGRVHPTWRAVILGACQAAGRDVCGDLQHRSTSQLHRLRDARSTTQRLARGHLQRKDEQAGSSSKGTAGKQAKRSTSTSNEWLSGLSRLSSPH
jgi:hypothetical protein